jgi:hypothetical protein
MGANFKPAEYIPEQDESDIPDAPPPPEYTRLPEPRDETGWRAEVRKRFRFTENWPLEKLELSHLILWGAAMLLVLVALVVFLASSHKQPDPKVVAATAAAATQDAQSQILGGTAYASVAALTPVTPTVNPATATALAVVGKTGKVTGLGGQALNVRQDASINAKVLTRLKEGDRVKVVGGPKAAEGQNWLQVEVNGQTGWVSDKYLTLE